MRGPSDREVPRRHIGVSIAATGRVPEVRIGITTCDGFPWADKGCLLIAPIKAFYLGPETQSKHGGEPKGAVMA